MVVGLHSNSRETAGGTGWGVGVTDACSIRAGSSDGGSKGDSTGDGVALSPKRMRTPNSGASIDNDKARSSKVRRTESTQSAHCDQGEGGQAKAEIAKQAKIDALRGIIVGCQPEAVYIDESDCDASE